MSPARHQVATAPLIAGMLDALVHATYERHAAGASLLLALDELANVAPLPSLPSFVSEGAGQGVVVLGCLQDLSQARVRWGTAADGFLSLFPTTVVLPGIADRPTLDALSQLAGRHDVVATSVSSQRRGRDVVTRSFVERPRLAADEIARGHRGFALVRRRGQATRVGRAHARAPRRAVLVGPRRSAELAASEPARCARVLGRVPSRRAGELDVQPGDGEPRRRRRAPRVARGGASRWPAPR